MNAITYEAVSRFSQQAGTLYFAVFFIAAVAWALWPKNKKGFDEAAQIPFNEQLPVEGEPKAGER